MTAERDDEPVTAFRDVVVIGGGCYGSFYAGQLAAARNSGKIVFRSVIVVDRDPRCRVVLEDKLGADHRLEIAEWGAYLDEFLARPAPPPGDPDDAVVPSPLMPHLMAEWLIRVAGRRGRPLARASAATALGTPYEMLAPDGTRYVSFADWLCPTHCVEPHVCPVIRAPRTWEMSERLECYVRGLSRVRPTMGPAVFVTSHRAFGVGMFDVAPARRALELLEGPAADLVVATVSSCHGAVTLLRPEPVAADGR